MNKLLSLSLLTKNQTLNQSSSPNNKNMFIIFMSPPLNIVTHVRNSEIKPLTIFFAMLWDINLIFGMWVYSDKLQIKFTFRSGPMIFGRVMALWLWNLAKYLVVTTFFRYALSHSEIKWWQLNIWSNFKAQRL
jgi:hypothetical protein